MDYNINENLIAHFLVLSSQIIIAQTAEAGVTLATKLVLTGWALEDAADVSWSHVYRIASEVKNQQPVGRVEAILVSVAEMIFELLAEAPIHRENVAARARTLRASFDCNLNSETGIALHQALEFAIEQKGLPSDSLVDGYDPNCRAVKM